jgi:opacity protein-like surface antigen
MIAIRMALAAALVATAGSAGAQVPAAPPPSSYLQLRLGIHVPQASDLDGFNNGVALEAAFGYRWHPNFAAELGIGYFKTSSDTVQTTSGAVDASISSIPVTASLVLIAPLGNVELKGLVGVGLHATTFDARVGGLSGSDSNTAFGFHIGGGASVALTPQVSLGADLRYYIVKPSFAGVDINIDGLQVAADLAWRF